MSTPTTGTNVCLLVGTLSRAPQLRTLPSGSELVELHVRIPRADGPADNVPVALHAPSASVLALAEGSPVVVAGRVQRRFFRAGGATQSRTEVVARRVLPASRRAGVARLVDGALAEIAAGPAG